MDKRKRTPLPLRQPEQRSPLRTTEEALEGGQEEPSEEIVVEVAMEVEGT